MMKQLAGALALIFSLLYPFLVFWGINNSMHQAVLIVLSCLLMCRIWLAKSLLEKLLMLVIAVVMAMAVMTVNKTLGLKLYPVLLNMALFALFTASLFSGMPIIERIARIREPHLCERAVIYTRKVTSAWCLFFAVNASISLVTVLLANDAVWLWYNGVVAYLMIAVLFSVEWLVRQRVKAGTA